MSLSAAEFETAAREWDVDTAALRAIADVESAGSGFMDDGRPKILFEGHIFWRRLRKHGHDPNDLLTPETADILYPTWTNKHYAGNTTGWDSIDETAGYDEWDRMRRARRIDPTEHDRAALESASWGKFQVLAMHWSSLGYATVGEFVALMHRSERDHLDACLRYCRANGLLDELRRHDWAGFARAYNGPRYAEHGYDRRLAAAYRRHADGRAA